MADHDDNRTALIRKIYDRRSPYYDRLIMLLSLGHEAEYRKEAVRRLKLKRGDRVLDLGCGTGLNFPLIFDEIGDEGFIVGIDSSYGMLLRAREVCAAMQGARVSLICADVTALQFPAEYFDALLCTYLFSTIPEYRKSLDMSLNSLKQGGRMAIADDILPAGWFAGPAIMISWLLTHGCRNYSREMLSYLRDRAGEYTLTRHHGGLIYLMSGIRPVDPEKSQLLNP
jgi:ubiquinone/menaquinone biosynthesis C-methylase UbiE